MINKIQIRPGKKSDLPATMVLINELAIYEKAADQVFNSVEELERDGFGENPCYTLHVAEKNDSVIGIALYFIKYSTWTGKCIYLEDIVVKESERGNGIGRLLFNQVALDAQKMKVRRMEWQVLDWNEPAINFYKKYESNFDGEWINCKLNADQIQNFKAKN